MTFKRYWPNGKPLTVRSYEDLRSMLKAYSQIKPRTIYASVNEYFKISERKDVYLLENISSATPTWDVDSRLDAWKSSLKAARIIIDELNKQGVEESVFLKWSGRGIHVHLHPNSVSREVYSRINPLDVAYSIVEYIKQRVESKIREIKVKDGVRELRVENVIDKARVFTAPLSIHRELDIVCVCFKPDDLDSFDINWINPLNFKHNSQWRRHVDGESDELALKAHKSIGGIPIIGGRRSRKTKRVEEMIHEAFKFVEEQDWRGKK